MTLLFLLGLQGQQPGTHVRVLDYEAPPADIHKLVDAADLIIVGRVVDNAQRSTGSGRSVRPFMEHQVRVLEVVKGQSTAAPEQLVQVCQDGGSVLSEGVREVVDAQAFPLLTRGETLVFFLTRNTACNGYVTTYGPGGAYRIEGSEVAIPQPARHITAFGNAERLTLTDFLAVVRAQVR
jgi:hypothetical protein